MAKSKFEVLQAKKQEILAGGGAKRVEKQHALGKLTARERLNLLFDKNTFVEVGAFITHRCTNFGMQQKYLPGEGVVTGYGQVDGKLVYAYAQDFTVSGGSLGEMHAKKITHIQDLALKVGAPIVGLNDSGGARIQEGIDALAGFGEIFIRNTHASGVIPQICAIMGPCAGGAVYSPALMDFIFMVDKTSQMFITGPEVIKTVTGEEVTSEILGGAMSHSTKSGVCHFKSSTDQECIEDIKRLLSFLPSNNTEKSPIYDTNDSPNRLNKKLVKLVPTDPNKAYDIKEIIYEISDNEDFYEVQSNFANNIVVGFSRINGETVGIIASQPKFMAGCMDINCSDKAARFIRTCDAFNIPLVTLVDVPGFLPGTSQEHNGIIRHGAKMLYAYSEATVPKITIITRKAYGGAYIAMSSKHLGADVVLAWPSSEIAVMGASGATNIVFKKDIKNANNPEQVRAQKIKEYEDEFATPYKAAERGYIDDVISPEYTRIRIIDALNMLATKSESRPAKKHGNIPL